MHILWIDSRCFNPFGDDLSHEEWAKQHGNDLETLLPAGWDWAQKVSQS